MYRWQDYEKLARLVAHRVKRFAPQAPASLDDLVQEAWIAFNAACRGYDPARGVKFSTYFARAAFLHLLRVIGVRSEEVSLDEESDDRHPLYERVAGSTINPLDYYAEKELCEREFAKLSPLAQHVLQLAVAPPPLLEEEFRAVVAHKALTSPTEAQRFESVGITWSFVMKVLRLPLRKQWMVSREINRFKEAVHGLEA